MLVYFSFHYLEKYTNYACSAIALFISPETQSRIMFGFLKRKKSDEMDDIFDIKSTITGKRPDKDFDEPRDPFGRPVKQEQDEWTPPFPGNKETGFNDFQPEPFKGPSKDYDLMQRLDVIESQLQAIRSQTETINERLKNMEFRITGGRRY